MSTAVSISSAGVMLRPEEPKDHPFLLALFAGTREQELEPLAWSSDQKSAFFRMQFEAQRRDYRARFPAALFAVIEHEGEPVGRLYVDRGAAEFRIIDIVLSPNFRGRGIGGELIESILEEAASAGRPVRIHVERSNRAMRLYQRLGFEPIGENGFHLLMEWRKPNLGARHVG